MKMEAATGVIPPQTVGRRGMPAAAEAGRGRQGILPQRRHLDYRAVRKRISVILSHQGCGPCCEDA